MNNFNYGSCMPYSNLYQPYQQKLFSNDMSATNVPNFQTQQQNGLLRVTGIEGAKAYQMLPKSVVALFDSGDDIMYIKSTDSAGFPTIRTFSFKAIESAQTMPTHSDYVSRSEFENFKQEVLSYGKQFVSKQQPIDNQSADNSASTTVNGQHE